MITKIELELFKCFSLLKLPLKSLTLLAGANASGKSTILQSMVLLHQTMLHHEWSTRLQLNGPEVQLGSVADVVDKIHGRREFRIALLDEACDVSWLFRFGDDKQAMSAEVASVTIDGSEIGDPSKLRFLLPERIKETAHLARRLRALTYLTAERVGPRDCYQLQDPSATQVAGPRGENAVGLLYQRRDVSIVKALCVKDQPPTLLKQAEARMKSFFPGTSLTVQSVPQTNFVTLGIRTSDATDFHRPVHVGFGLTQVFPIIVAALAAQAGDLLLIENPEVHLHPAGQALMGQFLAEVAAADVQVLVESHSDHVLSGIRRAVKEQRLAAENVALHFLEATSGDGVRVTSPMLDPAGNVDRWPSGFFDQFDRDSNYFAGWGE